jgi:3-dehydroquinate synthetase
MKTVEVDAAVRYNIVIDKGILPKSGDMIKEVTSAERVAVITDDTVDKLYSDVVMKSLSDAGFETFKFVFPHGEKSKNISTFSSILEFFIFSIVPNFLSSASLLAFPIPSISSKLDLVISCSLNFL